MAHVIADELSVKAVEFAEDESRFVSLRAKANFKVLGAKLGPRKKSVDKPRRLCYARAAEITLDTRGRLCYGGKIATAARQIASENRLQKIAQSPSQKSPLQAIRSRQPMPIVRNRSAAKSPRAISVSCVRNYFALRNISDYGAMYAKPLRILREKNT